MNAVIAEIEEALATVQRTLDLLTARGFHDAAFGIARLQFSASIRTSWPGNIVPLATALASLAANHEVTLSDQERAEIARAAATLKKLSE